MSVSHSPLRFRSLPPVLRALLVANVLGYIAMAFAAPTILSTLALIPAQVTGHLWLWQLLTYSFFHEGFFHLFFNLFALWMFGMEIEVRMGSRPFLIYYLITALGASLTQVAIMPHSPIPTVGASGAVYGILAAFAVLFPEAVVYLYFLIPLTATQMVLLFAGLEFVAGFSSGASDIANFAHLGGLATGWLYFKLPGLTDTLRYRLQTAFSLKRKPKLKVYEEKQRPAPTTHQDLSHRVDQILEKVLREGAQSLTAEEQRIMKEYSDKKKSTRA